ncbi:AraC family transcriptional regulator [Phytoactinopolyspora halotolerans]|uniref:AraC family transcriptional regulator n=1 Tax=Phytoactinopolyspora halotolerans TaxID=1981512 RepID=A0A6L9SH58_9ACTN|nr:AraC family transcriptional regulator [Phytoactinopolyspora halotolerans]NEE03974.1 AraC family transcriptional regulator [Phytoactinopolyspora halotolerans]
MTVTDARELTGEIADDGRGGKTGAGLAELRRLLADVFGILVEDAAGDADRSRFRGRKYRLGQILGGYLDLWQGVSLAGRIADTSYVLLAPALGSADAVLDDGPVAVLPGHVLVAHPGEEMRLTVGRRCRLWIVNIPLSAIHIALSALGEATTTRPLRFDRLMNIRQGPGQSWVRMATLIRQELESEGALVEVPDVARAYEQALVETLLRVHRHTYSDQIERQSAPGVGDGGGQHRDHWPRVLRAVLQQIDEHPTRRYRIDDLAGDAGVSTKTLQKYFREHLGVTPIEYLRIRRLDLAHQALLAADRSTTNVETVMRRLGFRSYGHFSRHYQQRFGQLPGDTLRLPPG